MSRITSYESFCKTLQEGTNPERKRARLLLWLQNWIIQAISSEKDYYFDYHLKGLLREKSSKATVNVEQDILGKIINESLNSIQSIMKDTMRSRIIRENVVMPIHKVRELNGYSMGWISRKSGDTIYEKIASANNKIMAVQKRHTYDTLENRLFMEFLRELSEHLFTKLALISDDEISQLIVHEGNVDRPSDSEIVAEISQFLTNPLYSEIRHWSNLPPNNTLLVDRYYKQIWKSWGELKVLDERFERDSALLGNHAANIFVIEVLAYINDSRSIRLPQEPISVNYENYTVGSDDLFFEALYKENQYFTIHKEVLSREGKSKVALRLSKKLLNIMFDNDSIEVYDGFDLISSRNISLESFQQILRYCVETLGFVYLPKITPKREKFNHIIVDIFSLYPQFMDEEESIPLTKRLLYQSYKQTNHFGDMETYQIPCDHSSAIKMIENITETYSMIEAIRNNSFEGTRKLLSLFDDEVGASSCHFVVPDIYDEFQLSHTLNSAAKMQYGWLQKTPFSIGTAFYYQSTENYKRFSVGNEILVSIDIDNESLVFTILDTSYHKLLDTVLPYRGVLWERHPRRVYSIKSEIQKVLSKLESMGCSMPQRVYQIFGLQGMTFEVGNLSIYFQDEEWFTFSDKVGEYIKHLKININEQINTFLEDCKHLIKGKKITFITHIEQILYEGSQHFVTIRREDVLYGCRLLEKVQVEIEEQFGIENDDFSLCLWKDYLEPLSIKRLIGEFKLIKAGQGIEPIVGKKVHIPIQDVFELPSGVSQYEFTLLKGDGYDVSPYSAVITNDIPFDKNIVCNLRLTYEYGAENPYELIFIPANKEDERYFKSRKVIWAPTDYKGDKLQRLEFPKKLTRQELCAYSEEDDRGKKWAETNVELVIAEEFFLPIAWGIEVKTIAEIQELIHKNEYLKEEKVIDIEPLKTWMIKHPDRKEDIISFTYDVNEVKDNKSRFPYIINHIKSGTNLIRKTRKRNDNIYTKWLFTLFLGNRIIDDGMPSELLTIFNRAKDNWLKMYEDAQTKEQKRYMIRRLSLAGKQLGIKYFDIVHDYLGRYKEDAYCTDAMPFSLISEIGCGLSDISTPEEEKMLQTILDTVDKENIIGMLAKALWHNELCIDNIDTHILLDVYLPEAVRLIHQCTEQRSYRNRNYDYRKETKKIDGQIVNSKWNPKIQNKMSAYFEFIMALMRLKYNGDENLNEQLSLKNPYLQQLVRDIEILCQDRMEFFTYIKIQKSDSIPTEYANIDVLLFIILVYITGYDVSKDISVLGYDYRKLL